MDRTRRLFTRCLLGAVAGAVCVGAWPVSAQAPAVEGEGEGGEWRTARLKIQSAGGGGGGSETLFHVEIAATPAQRSQGLQHRYALDADAGMLFLFDRPQPVAMWMKDTYISLDMLFLEADGRIVAIARHTKPQSLEVIRAPVPVAAVLEINAGTTREQGIRVGDRIVYAKSGRFLR
ncbi:MAG: DUF192 domain-containing protein [Rhodospirillales bacterium]|nr:DUF192 domain-containing protein [Rhodospirillales bacterium]